MDRSGMSTAAICARLACVVVARSVVKEFRTRSGAVGALLRERTRGSCDDDEADECEHLHARE